MKITGLEKINMPKIPTIRNLKQGDTFTFLNGDYENEILMFTDTEYAVRLRDGYSFDTTEYLDVPIEKLNCYLVIEEVVY